MTLILDGKKLRDKILSDIKNKVEKLERKPCLAVILVGSDPASQIYVKNKQKSAQDVGFKSELYQLDENSTSDEIKKLIEDLNQNKDVDGILLQLPLPKHLSGENFLELIDPNKDVDGFHPVNVGKTLTNTSPLAISCTPKGVVRLLVENNIELEGKNVVIIGRSNIVGKPLAALLTNENATVTLAHSKTINLTQIVKNADILISATGICGLITKDFVKEGAIVIDVGISRNVQGKILGDVVFDEVSKIASAITPVPGGVGPMTIAMLMENTLELYFEHAKF